MMADDLIPTCQDQTERVRPGDPGSQPLHRENNDGRAI